MPARVGLWGRTFLQNTGPLPIHKRERVLKLMDSAKGRRSASGHDHRSAGSEHR
jgi:hypothetical protein